jgi:hypothetical protein
LVRTEPKLGPLPPLRSKLQTEGCKKKLFFALDLFSFEARGESQHRGNSQLLIPTTNEQVHSPIERARRHYASVYSHRDERRVSASIQLLVPAALCELRPALQTRREKDLTHDAVMACSRPPTRSSSTMITSRIACRLSTRSLRSKSTRPHRFAISFTNTF